MSGDHKVGHVAGYTSGQGRHEAQIMIDRVSWEETWAVLRGTLALLDLLGAAAVHLQLPSEEPPQRLWPPP